MNLHFPDTFFFSPKTTKACRKIMAIIVACFCNDFLYFLINELALLILQELQRTVTKKQFQLCR